MGVGSSALIKYDGSGVYFVNISDKAIQISIEPDAKWLIDPWLQPKRKLVTSLDYNTSHTFELNLKKWKADKCVIYRVDAGKQKKIELQDHQLKFSALPGNYLITKEK